MRREVNTLRARLTPVTPAASVIGDGPSAWKVKREAGARVLKAGAVPATVSDEPSPMPLGCPGKAAKGSDSRARRPAITNCALEASSGRGAPDGSELMAIVIGATQQSSRLSKALV